MISGEMWSERAVAGQPSVLELAQGLEAPLVKAVAVHKDQVLVLVPGSVLQLEEEPNHRLPHLHHLPLLLLSANQTIAPSLRPNRQLSLPLHLRALAKEVPAHSHLPLSHLPLSHLALGAARQSYAIQQAA